MTEFQKNVADACEKVPEFPDIVRQFQEKIAKAERNNLKDLTDIYLSGMLSSIRGEFPPKNPHAPLGVLPDEEHLNIKGAVWFWGYWKGKEVKEVCMLQSDSPSIIEQKI